MANNVENNIENKMDMKGDDAAIVDDILNSLRDDGSGANANQQMPPNMQMQQQMPPNMQMQQQMPPNMQMQQQMPPNMQMQQEMEMPPEVEVEYDSNDSKVNTVLSMLKKPLIVIALAFILFNPLTSDMLSKHLPTVFGVTKLSKKTS